MSSSEFDAGLQKVLISRTAGKTSRVQGATDWWFYPLVAMLAAATIFLSLGATVFRREPVPQRGAEVNGSLVFGPRQLAAGTHVDPAQVAYIARELGFVPQELHLAVKPGQTAPGADDVGAQLLLDASQSPTLANAPVQVRVQFARIPITPATAIALSLENGGAQHWVTAPFPAEGDVVEINLPALKGPAPTALGIRMIAENKDLNFGAVIKRIEIKPHC